MQTGAVWGGNPAFVEIKKEFAAPGTNGAKFNFDEAGSGECKPSDIYDDIAIISYFSFKQSPVRFKVANVDRKAALPEYSKTVNETRNGSKKDHFVSALRPINKFMHLFLRHTLVMMQYALGQSSSFDDNRFIMGNAGVQRTAYGEGPLRSIFTYGRVPYMNYLGSVSEGNITNYDNHNAEIFTGIYDSIFFYDLNIYDTSKIWVHLSNDNDHCNIILNSPKAALAGILCHFPHTVDFDKPFSKQNPINVRRFTTPGTDKVEFWGSCYDLNPSLSNIAYSKHRRILNKNRFTIEANQARPTSGSRVL